MNLYQNEIEMLRKRGCRLRVFREYESYMSCFNDFTVGNKGFRTPFLLIVGNPGIGKSYKFKSIPNTKYIDNAASAVGMYRSAYLNRNKEALILDDVDGLLFDDSAISLLKALGDSAEEKRIDWQKQNGGLRKEGIPLGFRTKSRLCIICNECPKTSATKRGANVAALLDRVTDLVFFLPTAEAVHGYVRTWDNMKDHMDVWEHVGKYLDQIVVPTGRWYTNTIDCKRLGRDWKSYLKEQLSAVDPVLWTFASIYNVPDLAVEEKLEKFAEKTGMTSKQTFYNYEKTYLKIRGRELV